MSSKMRYRLALDLGTTSIGWGPCSGLTNKTGRALLSGLVCEFLMMEEFRRRGRLWQYNDAWRDSNAGRVIAVLGARTN